MASSYDHELGALGTRLRQMRRAADLTGLQLAHAAGWAQSKVSKIETGKQAPLEADIRTWARLSRASDDDLDDLLARLAVIRSEYVAFRQQLRDGQSEKQIDLVAHGREATRILSVEVAIVPGLLQTAEYARHRLRENIDLYQLETLDVDEAAANRLRWQEVLYDTTKQIRVVFTEAVLHTLLCPAEAMLGQLDRLLTASSLSNLEMGIIPFGRQLRTIPLHGFLALDDLVLVETLGAEAWLRGDEADIYFRVFDGLMSQASTGEDARQLIVRAADRLRTMAR
ncbi:MAG: helix-turn-helix transcriptional regulator [Actinocatenispora sp.]